LEKVSEAGVDSWRHYIHAPTGPVAVYIRKSSGTPSAMAYYLTRDHLGSIDSITNDAGAIQVRLAYDAFGERRKEAGWTSDPLPQTDWNAIYAITHRGFTFHEMLDDLGLVHMNGRVYDPVSGRFESADPFIPHMTLTQSYNRYSYVRNSPLSFFDPFGFADEEIIVTDTRCGWVGVSRYVNCGDEFGDLLIINLDFDSAGWPGGDWDNLPFSGGGNSQVLETVPVTQGDKCWRPFDSGDSFSGEYFSRLGNLAAGLLDSVKASGELGLQIKGKVNLGPLFNATGTFGVINGSLSTTAAGNVDLNVRLPSSGSWVYGEASAGAGNVKFGAARDSIVDGISVRRGPYEDYEEGFFFKPSARLAEPSWGKVGAHVQAGVGASLEIDLRKIGSSISCAFQ